MLHDSNHNVGKGPFVYKQTYLAFTSISRLLFNAVVYFTPRRYDQAVYDLITSLNGRFLAHSACEKGHRCKISHLRRMEPSNCRLPMAQSFMCCRVEQGGDKHIKGNRFSAFHNFRNSLYLKRAVLSISECFKNYFRQ